MVTRTLVVVGTAIQSATSLGLLVDPWISMLLDSHVHHSAIKEWEDTPQGAELSIRLDPSQIS